MAAPYGIPLPDKDVVTKTPSVHSTTNSLHLGDLVKSFEPVRKGDIAEDLFREIDSFSSEELEAEKIKVRKLIDWRIMPIVRSRSHNRI